MRLALALITLVTIVAAETPSQAQRVNLETALDQLMQWSVEDISRQRAKAREADAAEEAQRRLPDLSQYGTPAETSTRRSGQIRPSNEIHCRTMDLGDGDSATHCF